MATRRRREAVPPGIPVPVECVPVLKDQPLTVRWLMQPRGLLTHWGKDGPIGCPGEKLCSAPIHRGKTIWKGYASGEYWRAAPYEDWAPGVIEVTARLNEFLADHQLRGEIWRLTRQPGRGGREEVVGELVGTCNADLLRPAFAVEPVVFRIYSTVHVLLDVPPYLPPRQILTSSPGLPPTVEPGTAQLEERQRQGLQDAYRQQLLEGTLPASVRRAMPKLIAELEREIAAAAGRDTSPQPAAPPRPSPPPGPAPSTNGRTR